MLLFGQLQDDRAVLPLILSILEKIGLWDGPKRKRFLILFVSYCFTVVTPKLLFSYPDIPTCICGIAELIFISNVYCGAMLFWLQHGSFKQLIQELRSLTKHLFQDHPLHSVKQYLISFNHQVHRYANIYCLSIMFPVVFFMVAPVINSGWVYVRKSFRLDETNNASSELLMTAEFSLHMEQGFYGLDPRTNILHYTIFTSIVLPVMIVTAITQHTKVLMTFSSASYCEAMLHLVSMKLDYLPSLPKETLKDELREIVHVHRSALRCIQLLVATFQPMILVQLSFCILIWCSMMLYFVVADELNLKFVNLGILFFVITIETYAMCYIATRLSTQGNELIKAVYACGWEEMDADLRRRLQLMLLCAQKPVGLMAGKFCFIDMERFQKMVNVSYSCFIVLKDIF